MLSKPKKFQALKKSSINFPNKACLRLAHQPVLLYITEVSQPVVIGLGLARQTPFMLKEAVTNKWETRKSVRPKARESHLSHH